MHTQPLGAGVLKRSTRLADGRELIYFDDPGTTLGPDRAVDARTLDPRPATATMRQDVLTGDWVSVAKASAEKATVGGRKYPERTLVNGVASAETIHVGAPGDPVERRKAQMVPQLLHDGAGERVKGRRRHTGELRGRGPPPEIAVEKPKRIVGGKLL